MLAQLACSALAPGSVGRYAVIGISGVTLDVVVFLLLIGAGMDPVPATVLSTLAGIANNYVLNALFNFGSALALGSGLRFVTVGLVGLAVAAGSLELLVRQDVPAVWAKSITVPVVVVAQFLANKHWSFRT
jgi:putative flippase GtrA